MKRYFGHRKRVSILLLMALLTSFTVGFPFPAYAAEYKLGPGDVLQISVWGHEDLSQVVTIRPDGMIGFPLVGEVKAADLTPEELQKKLAEALAEYVRNPQVIVTVKEFRRQLLLERVIQVLTGLSLIKAIIE